MSHPQPAYDLTVVGVVAETPDAHSVSFAVPEGAEDAFDYRPGQFLTLAVPSDETGLVARSYSLSSAPGDGGPLTVTVKRTATGYASNWICDHLVEGATVRVLPPSGGFTPRDLDADLLLLAGGSGITPMMSIIRTALARGTGRLALLYANRDRESVIFAAELDRLVAEHPDRLEVHHWLESERGLPTAVGVRNLVEQHASYETFLCGPAPFMDLVVGVLRQLEVPRERWHQEVFVSLHSDPFGHEVTDEGEGPSAAGGARIEVELEGQTHVFDDWPRDTKLLDHLEAKGLRPPYSCRDGECSTCEFMLLEGEVSLVRNYVLDDQDLEDGVRLACQALPTTDVVRAKYL